MKRISAVGANLKHATVEAQIGVHIRCFKIKVVPERHPGDVPLENRDIARVKSLVADYRRIINGRGIWGCVGRRHGYSGVRGHP